MKYPTTHPRERAGSPKEGIIEVKHRPRCFLRQRKCIKRNAKSECDLIDVCHAVEQNAWIRRRFIGNQIDIIREERTA